MWICEYVWKVAYNSDFIIYIWWNQRLKLTWAHFVTDSTWLDLNEQMARLDSTVTADLKWLQSSHYLYRVLTTLATRGPKYEEFRGTTRTTNLQFES